MRVVKWAAIALASLFVLFVAAICLGALAGRSLEEANQTAATEPAPAHTASISPRHHLLGGHLSMRKYQQIADGMSYEEVVGILGREGVEAGSAGAGGDTVKTYTWTNFSGATVSVMFEKGAVTAKGQTGL